MKSDGLPSSVRATRDVLRERERQFAKGYDAAHDAKQTVDDLAERASFLLLQRGGAPAERRVRLVKAAAVALATVDRMDQDLP